MGTLLMSHLQHTQMTRTYFDLIEGREEADFCNRKLDMPPAAEVEEEVAQLQKELSELTEEANRRIEKGNEAILKLKTRLKQLSEVEMLELQQQHSAAEKRCAAARSKNANLRAHLDGHSESNIEEELNK